MATPYPVSDAPSLQPISPNLSVHSTGDSNISNDLTIIGALAGVEMGLELAGIPHREGGVQAAMAYFAGAARGRPQLTASP